MRDARSTGRVATLLATFMTLSSGAAHAATNATEDAITGCAMHEVKDARIACLENAMRRAAGDGAAHEAPASVAERAAKRTPAPSERPVSRAETSPRPIPAAELAGDEPPAAEAPVAEQQSRTPGTQELGAEQVARRGEARADADAPVKASVIAFDVVGYRRLVVELDNGQIWRQTKGDRADVARGLRNEQAFDVELRRTGLGGYRMYITPLDRTIRVERLK